jgi:sugar phosphate isomerase/epimerase
VNKNDLSNSLPIGVQLYSVRHQCASDLSGTLSALADIGYRGIEFAGYYERSAKSLRQMLDDLNLVACSSHIPYEAILSDNLTATIDFNLTLRNQFLIVPWMSGNTRRDWLAKAQLFNDVAATLKQHGLFLGYHAHEHDFRRIGGETTWDIFFNNTEPEVVMQLDTGNCRQGGVDPLAVLKKHPGRAASIHLQTYGGGTEAIIGEDQVDWYGILVFCKREGITRWFIVEHETSKDTIDTARKHYEAVTNLLNQERHSRALPKARNYLRNESAVRTGNRR